MFNYDPIGEKQLERVKKYKAAKLDRLGVYVPKGRLEDIKSHAKLYQPAEGESGKPGYSPAGSMSAFVNRAIREAMERDFQQAEAAKEKSKKKAEKKPKKAKAPKKEVSHDIIMEEAAKVGLITAKKKPRT